MIRSLEELSIKLLYRSRVEVKLTREGVKLYPFLERTILQFHAMQEKVNEIKGLETGVIRIGTISSVTCHWLPQLMKEFQQLYPKVQFLLHQGDYTSIQEWIKIGAVDFGFVTPPVVSGLETITIKDGEMLAVLPKKHPMASKDKIDLKDIAAEPFILLEEGHYNEPLKVFRNQGLEPNIKYTLHDDYAIMIMVEAELVLQRTNFNLVALPTEPDITRTLAVGYKDKYSLPIASKYFIDFIISNIHKLP